MNIRLASLILILIPVIVVCGFVFTHKPMSAPVVVVLGAIMIWLGYTRYAKVIDRDVIKPDPKKATPCECTLTA